MRLNTIISETSVICTVIRETEFAIFLKLFAFLIYLSDFNALIKTIWPLRKVILKN